LGAEADPLVAVTYGWDRGRLARNAPQGAKLFIPSRLFALRAHCGRDARGPSHPVVSPSMCATIETSKNASKPAAALIPTVIKNSIPPVKLFRAIIGETLHILNATAW